MLTQLSPCELFARNDGHEDNSYARSSLISWWSGLGAYASYKACGGFNSCNNPVCKVNCYENGKRVR